MTVDEVKVYHLIIAHKAARYGLVEGCDRESYGMVIEEDIFSDVQYTPLLIPRTFLSTDEEVVKRPG